MQQLQKMKTALIGSGMISGIYLKNMKEQFGILELVGCSESPADVLATVGLRGPVDLTVVHGKVVVEDGHLTTIDEAAIAEKAQSCCAAYLANA